MPIVDDTDTQRHLERVALIGVKVQELDEMNRDLLLGFMHLRQMMQVEASPNINNFDATIRTNILDLRAVIEDILLSIRLSENELHDMGAPGW